MKQSKSLSVVPSFEANIVHIREYHRLAMNSAAQAVCAAAMVGLELQKVKLGLKKSASGCTFDQWLEENDDKVGFARRTAFKYMALAENLKSKLLKSQDKSVVGLIGHAPSDLNERQMKTLLLAMNKSVDGQSLSDLYEDFGITRKHHAQPKRLGNGAATDGDDDEPPPVTIDELLADQLERAAKFSDALKETVELHGTKVLVISQHETKNLDVVIEIAKRAVAVLVKLRNGKAGK